MVAETIPLQEPLDSPPKRGRKPLTDEQKARNNERAKLRRASSSGKRPRGRPRRPSGPKSLYPEIMATLTMVNMLAAMSPLGSRPEREAIDKESGATLILAPKLGDELDEYEIAALSTALDAQCQRSPRFRKQVERILGVGAGGQLVTVVGMIFARRASRHGILPPQVDPMLGVLIEGGNLGALGGFAESADPDAVDDMTGEQPPRAIPLPDLDEIGSVGYDDL